MMNSPKAETYQMIFRPAWKRLFCSSAFRYYKNKYNFFPMSNVFFFGNIYIDFVSFGRAPRFFSATSCNPEMNI